MTTSVSPLQVGSKAGRSLTYDQTITPSGNMIATGGASGNDNDLDDTINNLISTISNLKGVSNNWYDAFAGSAVTDPDERTMNVLGTDLATVEQKDFLFNRLVLVDLGTLTATLRVLTDPTETPTVDAAITAGTEGAVATGSAVFATARTAGVAVIAGDLFSAGAPNTLRPLNLGAVFNGTTGDPVVTASGNQMKCLLITERTTDGAWGNTATTDRGAVVFVEINATNDGYVYGDFNDLPSTVNYTYTERSEFLNLNEWAFLNEPSADAVAGTDVTLTLAATNQSGTVDSYGSKNIDWEIPDTFHFQYQDDAGSNILIMSVDGSNNRTVTIGVASGNDVTTIEGTTLDINVTGDVTMASGLIIEDGGNPDINIGVTAGQMDIVTGTLTVTGASGLDLAAGASGPVNIDSVAGAVSVDGITSSNFTITGNAAGDQTLTLAATNAGAGDGVVAISADGEVTVDSTASSVSVDGVTSSNFTVTGNAAGDQTLTLSATNAGAGDGVVAISADGEVTVASTASSVSVTGTAASDFTVASADLTLETTTSGDIFITSAAEVDVTGTCVGAHPISGTEDTSSFHSEMERFQLWGTSSTTANGSFIGHNTQRVSTTAKEAGTWVVLSTSATVTDSITATTAATGPADALVSVVSSALFSVGDLVTITGSANDCNDDVFEVASIPSGTGIALRGPNGVTPRVLAFTGLDLATAGAGGTIQKASISVIQTGTDGLWEGATGDDDTLVFQNFQGATTLQQAYDNGNVIVTTATSGNLDVSGTEAISLDASAASNFTVTGAGLTLATLDTGNILISAADQTTAATAGGNASLLSGDGNTTGPGGTVFITGGGAGATSGADGGPINIDAGPGATGGSGTGGAVSIDTGLPGSTTGESGALSAGTPGGGSVSGNSGTVSIFSGDVTDGTAGLISIIGSWRHHHLW
jgi:hypothetical protein